MKQEWDLLWSNKRYLAVWLLSFIAVLITLKCVSLYLVYNEGRTIGVTLDDFVLAKITPRNVATPLFCITWISIISGLLIALRTPQKSLLVFYSIIVVAFLRCFTMYLFPLFPPEGIIPLRDSVLEETFYCNAVFTKDLFFSGHTANMVLIGLLVDIKWIKKTILVLAVVVGILLLVQHVHYTIDVVAAPFFAVLSYWIACKITDFVHRSVNVPSISDCKLFASL